MEKKKQGTQNFFKVEHKGPCEKLKQSGWKMKFKKFSLVRKKEKEMEDEREKKLFRRSSIQ